MKIRSLLVSGALALSLLIPASQADAAAKQKCPNAAASISATKVDRKILVNEPDVNGGITTVQFYVLKCKKAHHWSIDASTKTPSFWPRYNPDDFRQTGSWTFLPIAANDTAKATVEVWDVNNKLLYRGGQTFKFYRNFLYVVAPVGEAPAPVPYK